MTGSREKWETPASWQFVLENEVRFSLLEGATRKNPSLFSIAAISVLLLVGSGCATIIQGTTQKVPVSSVPSGARVTLNESTAYTTPTALELSRKEHHTLQFSLEGYQPEVIKLESVTSGVVMGNILLGGLIGWGVDAASGGQYRLVPETVHITLRPISAPGGSPGTGIPSQAAETLEDRLKYLKGLRDKDLIGEDEYQATRKRLLDSYSK